jgi:hypothetical protein
VRQVTITSLKATGSHNTGQHPTAKKGKHRGKKKKRNTGGGTWEKEQNILDKREKTNEDQVNLKRIPTYKDSVKNNLENSNTEIPEVKIPP